MNLCHKVFLYACAHGAGTPKLLPDPLREAAIFLMAVALRRGGGGKPAIKEKITLKKIPTAIKLARGGGIKP